MRRLVLIVALAAPAALFAQGTQTAGAQLQAAATAAYNKKDYARCADLFAQAGRQTNNTDNFYYAATCQALGGNKDDAFKTLAVVLDRGFSNTRYLQKDPDLSSLRSDPRWDGVVARSEANFRKRFSDSNRELWSIRDDDQEDRETEKPDWEAIRKRDLRRRARVREILAADGVTTAMDYYNAALVMQHGDSAEEYRQAYDLAMRAVAIDPKNTGAAWLAAAAEDRYLQCIGKPQIYGTQFRRVSGVWTLDPIDESAVTDEERARMHVPPLADAKRHAAEANIQ
jgi:tetratricopeptide (TPR) repeat protein